VMKTFFSISKLTRDVDTYIHISNHSYEHTYANPIHMSNFKRLG
jgi:hypothetical protein